ncbi:DUF805 domain-containing protein [Flavobacterium difficile]|uniref:DUF805 domain-containing protein n=1 Tax=Flavobacterium difficile TaxID=2709659 RepID=UPI001A9C2AFC|nr:DUF805 domain-containing protein [Flavobacterium difficile]
MKKAESEYTIFDWWKKVVFENFANFSGRARRKEYWSFQLVNILLIIIPYIFLIISVFSNRGELGAIGILSAFLLVFIVLGTFVPSLAVVVRRLHDTNRSGWNFLLGLVPFFGGLILLYFYFSDGSVGRNSYGNDPKRPHNEISEIGVVQE